MATKSKSRTGSQKLAKRGRGFSAAGLRAFIAVLKKHRLNRDILIDGIPDPDFIKGSFTTRDPGAAFEVMRAAVRLGGTYRPLRLFPKGQPSPIIDQFEVEIPGIKAR